MNLKDQLIHDTFAETMAKIAIIEAHAGQLAECEALAERITKAAPTLDGKPVAHVNTYENSLTTRVLIIAARESELREALADADLKIQSIQIGTPTASSLRIHLAGGIRTVIDVIIVVDELEATPPAAMPLAA